MRSAAERRPPFRTLKTSEAASLLSVCANTVRTWEERFGYPRSDRSVGKHRLYYYWDVVALNAALEQGLSISSAVSIVSRSLAADASALVGALSAFSAERADAVMEGSLALRSLERSLEEVLAPGLDAVRLLKGEDSTIWAFACSWSGEWLIRARRLSPHGARLAAIMIGDATLPPLDPARPSVLALELCCLRAGLEVLRLPLVAHQRLGEAVNIFGPDALVIAGNHVPDDDLARWAYQVRAVAGRLPTVLFHRPLPAGIGTSNRLLPPSPVAAHRELIDFLGLQTSM